MDLDHDPTDQNGHGTHVAGTIAALGNNGRGSSGICWRAQIMPVRVLDYRGIGYSFMIAKGVVFAVDHGARVINMSLGTYWDDQLLYDALAYARDKGVLVVVAAGNSGLDIDQDPSSKMYPCSYDLNNIVCVAAMNQKGGRSWFSNYGSSSVDIAAPGENIVSTWNGSLNQLVPESFSTTDWTRFADEGTGGNWGVSTLPGDLSNTLHFPENWDGKTLYPKNTTATVLRYFQFPNFSPEFVSSGSPYFYKMTLSYRLGSDVLRVYGKTGTTLTPDWTHYLARFDGASEAQGTCFQNCDREVFFDDMNRLGTYGRDIVLGFRVTTGSKEQNTGVVIHSFSVHYLDVTQPTYNVISGTSMATPHVTGLATLILAENPKYTYLDIIQALREGGTENTDFQKITKWGKTANAPASLTYLAPPTEIRGETL